MYFAETIVNSAGQGLRYVGDLSQFACTIFLPHFELHEHFGTSAGGLVSMLDSTVVAPRLT